MMLAHGAQSESIKEQLLCRGKAPEWAARALGVAASGARPLGQP